MERRNGDNLNATNSPSAVVTSSASHRVRRALTAISLLGGPGPLLAWFAFGWSPKLALIPAAFALFGGGGLLICGAARLVLRQTAGNSLLRDRALAELVGGTGALLLAVWLVSGDWTHRRGPLIPAAVGVLLLGVVALSLWAGIRQDGSADSEPIGSLFSQSRFGRGVLKFERRESRWAFDSARRLAGAERAGTVTLFVLIVFMSLTLGGGAALALGIGFQVAPPKRSEARNNQATGGEHAPALPRPPAGVGPIEPLQIDRFLAVCGDGPVVYPGEGAPNWAAKELWNLYFERGRGVGAAEAGCPTRTEVLDDGTDEVAYQLGRRQGELVAVALVSRLKGGSVVFGEPARFVQDLISQGIAPSAEPRANVGNGDVQFVYTNAGTWSFVRTRKTTQDHLRQPYVVLAPLLTVVWLAEMQDAGKWLWPVVVGEGEFAFLDSLYAQPKSTVRQIDKSRVHVKTRVDDFEATFDIASVEGADVLRFLAS